MNGNKERAAHNMPLKTNAVTPRTAYAIPKSHALVLAATRWVALILYMKRKEL